LTLNSKPQKKYSDLRIQLLVIFASKGPQSKSSMHRLVGGHKNTINMAMARLSQKKAIQFHERLKKTYGSPELFFTITDIGLKILMTDSRVNLEQFWEIMYMVFDAKIISTKIPFTECFSNYEENVLKIKLDKTSALWSIVLKNISDIYQKPLKWDMRLFVLYVLAMHKEPSLKEIKKQYKKLNISPIISSNVTEKILDGMVGEKIISKFKTKFKISVTGLVLLLTYLDEAYPLKKTSQLDFIDIKPDLKRILKNSGFILQYFSKLCLKIPSIVDHLSVLKYFGYVYTKSTYFINPIQLNDVKELVMLERIMEDVNREKLSKEVDAGAKVRKKLVQENIILENKKSSIYDHWLHLAKLSGGYIPELSGEEQKILVERVDHEIELALRNKVDFELFCYFLHNINDWKKVNASFQEEGEKTNFANKFLIQWKNFLKENKSFVIWFNQWIDQIVEFEESSIDKIKSHSFFNLV